MIILLLPVLSTLPVAPLYSRELLRLGGIHELNFFDIFHCEHFLFTFRVGNLGFFLELGTKNRPLSPVLQVPQERLSFTLHVVPVKQGLPQSVLFEFLGQKLLLGELLVEKKVAG